MKSIKILVLKQKFLSLTLFSCLRLWKNFIGMAVKREQNG